MQAGPKEVSSGDSWMPELAMLGPAYGHCNCILILLIHPIGYLISPAGADGRTCVIPSMIPKFTDLMKENSPCRRFWFCFTPTPATQSRWRSTLLTEQSNWWATEVRLRDISEADHTDLTWCDGIALGSPTNYGTVSWQMKKWWDEQPIENWGHRDGRIGCVFSSAGAWGGGQEWTCMTLMSILINYGFLVFGLTDYTGIKFSAHYGAISAGPPADERTRETCRRLGLRLAEWTTTMIDGRKEAHPLKQTYERFQDIGK